MGSICAHVKEVTPTVLKCEIQNEGWIYENQTIVFGMKFKKDKTRFMNKQGSNLRSSTSEISTPGVSKFALRANNSEMENEKKYHAEAETPTNLPIEDDESEEDADDENLREDVRFIL